MGDLKKVFSIQKLRPKGPRVQAVPQSPHVLTQDELKKFAEAFVRDYGETLRLLGKE